MSISLAVQRAYIAIHASTSIEMPAVRKAVDLDSVPTLRVEGTDQTGDG